MLVLPEGLAPRGVLPEMRVPEYLTPAEHQELIFRAALPMAQLAINPGFHRAVEPAHPDTEVEVFVAPPGYRDKSVLWRRNAADRVNDLEFARKDGDDPVATRRELLPYRDNDYRLLTVRHFPGEESVPEPQVALRLIGPVEGLIPHSLLALESEWGLNTADALDKTTFSDGSSLPDDFLVGGKVWDIALVSNLQEVNGETDFRMLMAMYNAALRTIKANGGEFIIGVMDIKAVYKQLRMRGPKDWTEVAGVWPKAVLTRVEHDHLSTFGIGRIVPWEKNIRARLGALIFGDELEREHHTAITGIAPPGPYARKNVRLQ